MKRKAPHTSKRPREPGYGPTLHRPSPKRQCLPGVPGGLKPLYTLEEVRHIIQAVRAEYDSACAPAYIS